MANSATSEVVGQLGSLLITKATAVIDTDATVVSVSHLGPTDVSPVFISIVNTVKSDDAHEVRVTIDEANGEVDIFATVETGGTAGGTYDIYMLWAHTVDMDGTTIP